MNGCGLTSNDISTDERSLMSIVFSATLEVGVAWVVSPPTLGVAITVGSFCGTVFLRELNANFFLGNSSSCLACTDCLSSDIFYNTNKHYQ